MSSCLPVSSPTASHVHISGLALNQLETVPTAGKLQEQELNHTAICSISCTPLQVALNFMLMCQLSAVAQHVYLRHCQWRR